LLAVGANPNDIGGDDQSPLMIASDNGCIEAVSALIAAGADVNLVHKGYTSLDLAKKKQNDMVVAELTGAGGLSSYDLMKRKYGLVRAVADDDIDLVNKLVADAGDAEKEDALRFAVRIPTQSNTLASIKCLLAAGTDPSLPCRQSSLVGLAIAEGKTDVVKVLVDADADISAKNDVGRTPLQAAAQGKHREVVALLLAKANELKKANK
jgi:ankyrin repeat protein